MVTEIFYTIIRDEDAPIYSVIANVTSNLREWVKIAVTDYYNNHYGKESSWPITFSIYNKENGLELGRFEVDLDMIPSFSVVEKEIN